MGLFSSTAAFLERIVAVSSSCFRSSRISLCNFDAISAKWVRLLLQLPLRLDRRQPRSPWRRSSRADRKVNRFSVERKIGTKCQRIQVKHDAIFYDVCKKGNSLGEIILQLPTFIVNDFIDLSLIHI